MDFIEREKLRIEEEQKKKDAEKKAKEDIVKRKELELQNKRDSIYKKVGPFMEQLLKKTIEKQQQAEAEKLSDPINDFFYGLKFKDWEWEINWLNTTPRLWGHFKTGEGYEDFRFDSAGKAERESSDDSLRQSWAIYVKCLVDIDKMALNITAKAERVENEVEKAERASEKLGYYREFKSTKSLQAPYLGKKGLMIPITNDASFIDRIADLLIEIRYTWKFDVDEHVWKNIRYKSINKSLKYLETSLQSYDNFIEEIEKKNPETFAKNVGKWVAIPAWILFIIYMFIEHGVAGGIFLGIILGVFGYGIVYGIIYGISKLLASSLGYSYNKEDEKKDLFEKRHKIIEISDLLKNLRATIDNDNIEEFVGYGFFLEFPLRHVTFAESEHYTKKYFISKIEKMIRRSKYVEKSD